MPHNFTIHEAPQGTPEWLAARVGRATASRAKDILATIKTGEAAARRDYRIQLVCERLTGAGQDDVFVNADMERGTALEPEARRAYEAQTGQWVDQVGFLAHADLMAGASPDGVIGDYEGLVEIKCPRPANHLRYLKGLPHRLASVGEAPKEHAAQITHLLWLTGAAWLDFVSYCPALPDHLALVVRRVDRDEAIIDDYDAKVRAFLAEVDNELAALVPVGEALAASMERITDGLR
ncbi:MAG: YqaJ viral recombinase family protein [Acidobacteria bacterium]|nr:YqaJ viral recombinase family protein [Acidobacteriota bacterium]